MKAVAGVVLDGTLGRGGALTGPTYSITPDLGRQIGGNLFQSFSSFTLSQGETALFSGPAGIQNILARVTGGGASDIDGTLASSISGANLFLINPQGITFGPHASLSLSGSFYASTADYVELQGGARFHTRDFSGDSLLTSAPVSAFGFLSSAPAAITVNQSTLGVSGGAHLALVGGDLNLHGATLTGFDGDRGGAASHFELISAASSGQVLWDLSQPLSLPNVGGLARLGNVTADTGTAIRANGTTSGRVVIRGGTLTLDHSSIFATTTGTGKGQEIDVSVRTMNSTASTAGTFTSGSGQAGDLLLRAATVALAGRSFFGSQAFGTTSSSAAAGKVSLQCARLDVTGGSVLDASTFGPGAGGSVDVRATDTVRLTGDPTLTVNTGIFANSQATGESGRAGNIHIETRRLVLDHGGVVSSSVYGSGAGGRITVAAGEVAIKDGEFFADTVSGSTANAGDIRLFAGSLFIGPNGRIESASGGLGNGGRIFVQADRIFMLGNNLGFGGSGIDADNGGFGAGGNIVIQTNTLTMLASAAIEAAKGSFGPGGNVSVFARDSIFIQGSYSGIFATNSTGAPGPAGNATVRTDSLTLLDGGEISTATFGQGSAGVVGVQANTIFISGAHAAPLTLAGLKGEAKELFAALSKLSPNIPTGILAASADPVLSGSAGQVEVAAGQILLSAGGVISSSTFGPGEAGDVNVNAGSLTIDGAGFFERTGIASTSESERSDYPGGPGGAVNITAANLSILGGGEISALTRSAGAGGNIRLEVGALSIDGTGGSRTTGVSAQTLNPASDASGGNIAIDAGSVVLQGGGSISASTSGAGSGGRVKLHVGQLALTGGASISASTSGTGPSGDIQVQAGQVAISSAGGATRISAESTSTGEGGDGGSIVIDAHQLQIDGGLGSGITASSLGLGKSGSVTLRLGSLDLLGGALVQSANTGGGDAGSVTVSARGPVQLDGASELSTSAAGANAGTITVTSGSDITLLNGSRIAASAGFNGGEITLSAPGEVRLVASSIVATAGAAPGLRALTGAGGNILIDPSFLVLDQSLLSANAAQGRGGNITLVSDSYFPSETLLTATGGQNGTINIAAPELDLSNALVGLPASLLDVSTQLREQCARRLGQDFSSFLLLGSGGAPLAPDEPQPSGPEKRRAP